jgi:protein gp37
MMNKTKIDWADFTWNPVTGCWGPGGTKEKPNRCSYCYAVGVAKRFYEYGNERGDAFEPQFHPDRLSQPSQVKKPSKIFVCSMADLFGDWVPSFWINGVLATAMLAQHHTFQFLTKNPKRLREFNSWPANCWVGMTVTNQADADERLPWLLQVDASVRFVSHEPLLGPIDISPWDKCDQCGRLRNSFDPLKNMNHPWTSEICHNHYNPFGGCDGSYREHSISWAIIGAMTGPGAVKPKTEWVWSLVDQYQAAGVPVFLKDNLGFKTQIQGWP